MISAKWAENVIVENVTTSHSSSFTYCSGRMTPKQSRKGSIDGKLLSVGSSVASTCANSLLRCQADGGQASESACKLQTHNCAKWYPFRGCVRHVYISSSELGKRKVRKACSSPVATNVKRKYSMSEQIRLFSDHNFCQKAIIHVSWS